MDIDQLKRFRQLGSMTPGHPEYGHAPGIETTTGPLGQGLGNAVGMALAERLLNQRYGNDIVDHYTYVVAGDGCLMEGISQEAISLAGHLRLGKLIVLFDDNQISIDGPTSLSTSDDQIERFSASRWHTARVDGHDPEAIALAIENARAVTDRPSLIACRTIIGYGAPKKQGTASTHGSPLGEDEIAGARERLGWGHAPFEVPKPVLAGWRAAGTRHAATYERWQHAAGRLDAEARTHLTDPIDAGVSKKIAAAVKAIKADFSKDGAKLATRQSSQKVIEKLYPIVPGFIGGSADLTGSVGTLTKLHGLVTPGDYRRQLHPLRRPRARHGRGHERLGTSWRYRALRRHLPRVLRLLPALDQALGDDGAARDLCADPRFHRARRGWSDPSAGRAPRGVAGHPQPQRVPACRFGRMRRVLGDRPRYRGDSPSVLALTRQGLPLLRTTHTDENLSAKGAYVLIEPEGGRDVTLIGTGSEVAIAVAAAKALQGEGIKAAVISLPCWELFAAQSEAYRDEVLGTAPRVAVEAAVEFGWRTMARRPRRFRGHAWIWGFCPGARAL